MINALLFWLILLLGFCVAYALGARSAPARTAAAAMNAPPVIPSETMAAMESKLEPMLSITGRKAAGGVFQFEGTLRGKPEEMFRKIREALAGEPVTPLLLEGEADDVRVLMLPGIGSSVLLACLAKMSLGVSVLAGNRLLLHPPAFAG